MFNKNLFLLLFLSSIIEALKLLMANNWFDSILFSGWRLPFPHLDVICSLRLHVPEVKQVWLAGDSAGGGRIEDLHRWYEYLCDERVGWSWSHKS